MGYLLSEKDGVTSDVFHPESRRESFIIHYEDENPHPEWLWTDLDELMETLEALQKWAHGEGIATRKIKPPTVTVELPREAAEFVAAPGSWGEHMPHMNAVTEAARAALEAEE